jgi:hypothetical protein
MKAGRYQMAPFQGVCMWPGLREGDMLVYSPLEDGDLVGLVGQIAVASSPTGPVAHRVRSISGSPGKQLILAGDLSANDAPRGREEILGVAKALYRPGQGFIELPGPLTVGPMGRVMLQRLGRFFTWARRFASPITSAASRS